MFACRMFGLHWRSDIPNPATGEFRDVRQTSSWRLQCLRKANWWNCDLRQILEFKDANTLPYLVINCEGVLSICTIQDISKHCPSICISVEISQLLGSFRLNCGFSNEDQLRLSSARRCKSLDFKLAQQFFFPKELTFAIRLGHLDMVNRIPLIYYNLHQFTSIFNLNFFDSRFCISNGQDLTWSRWLPQLPNMHMQKPGSLWLWGGSTKYLQIPSSSIVLVCTYSDLFIKDWLMASLHQLDTLFTSWYHETLIMSIMFCELVRWNDWTESSTARAMFRNHNA